MRIGLLPRLIIGIITGVILGSIMPESVVRILVTFRDIFGEFLNYIIPFIIIAFVAPGIADLGKDAGKLLGITTGLAYLSTIIAGFSAFFIGKALLPNLVSAGNASNPEEGLLSGFFEIAIDPMMGVMTALVTAFLFGLGMAAIKHRSESLYDVLNDFKDIIEKAIQNVIIPLLPFYIAAVFANMTYAGDIFKTMTTFIKVFALVIILHIVYLLVIYIVSGSISGTNPFKALKNMLPAYFTAIGTQSSAATIPVTLKQAKVNNVSEDVADFAIPLCATIHLAGSTITLVICSMAVMLISGLVPEINSYSIFILMLGITMIAAPGVPGGAVMAALGLLELYLGFGETAQALMIALYLTQDSFGTACNVTGDGAIAMMVDRFNRLFKSA